MRGCSALRARERYSHRAERFNTRIACRTDLLAPQKADKKLPTPEDSQAVTSYEWLAGLQPACRCRLGVGRFLTGRFAAHSPEIRGFRPPSRAIASLTMPDRPLSLPLGEGGVGNISPRRGAQILTFYRTLERVILFITPRG